jgi:uroporphyrinogen decarboxylase
MNEWVRSVMASPVRHSMPIMTHPGIDFIGKRVLDVVTDGQVHYEAIQAVNDHFPAIAATVVMDLTVEAEAFGAQVHFTEHEVPSVTGRLVSGPESVEKLEIPDMTAARLPQYLLANKLAASHIEKPVFSGCIGPFSLAGRLYDMSEIMTDCYLQPDAIHLLLQKCTDFLKAYCQALKAQGTSGVVMAEPAAGLLSDETCEEFSSDYVRQVVDAVQDEHFIVILHNCGNSGQCTNAMLKSGATGLHFGNAIDMVLALEQCPADVLVLGNIDPVRMFKMATPEVMYHETLDLLKRTAGHPNFVLSSGCDTPPNTPIPNIRAFYSALDDYNHSI